MQRAATSAGAHPLHEFAFGDQAQIIRIFSPVLMFGAEPLERFLVLGGADQIIDFVRIVIGAIEILDGLGPGGTGGRAWVKPFPLCS